MIKVGYKIIIVIILIITFKLCCPRDEDVVLYSNFSNSKAFFDSSPSIINIPEDITVENYFAFIDSIVKKYNPETKYLLTEHLLVRSNTWIIDTLLNTDYYRMKARDSFVYNQKKMIALPRGNSIIIPDSSTAHKILYSFEKTLIDVNIPEFKLRIYEDSTKLYEFPVRVGRNEKKYL